MDTDINSRDDNPEVRTPGTSGTRQHDALVLTGGRGMPDNPRYVY